MTNPDDLERYIDFHRRANRGIRSDITMRWLVRVEQRGLHLLGEDGATIYLRDFGRNIGEEKVIQLALKADIEGHFNFGRGFWKKAFELYNAEKGREDHSLMTQAKQPSKELRQKIEQAFSLDELRTMCFDIGFDYESINSENKGALVRELLLALHRQGKLPELLNECKQHRPNINWDTLWLSNDAVN